MRGGQEQRGSHISNSDKNKKSTSNLIVPLNKELEALTFQNREEINGFVQNRVIPSKLNRQLERKGVSEYQKKAQMDRQVTLDGIVSSAVPENNSE